jgi:hypothetical protein
VLVIVRSGNAAATLNVKVLLVWPETVTSIPRGPTVALAAIANVDVALVAETTFTLLIVIPPPNTFTAIPGANPVPASATLTLLPRPPTAGVRLINDGGPKFTVNATAPLVPPVVATVTLRAPTVELGAIPNVAVAVVGDATLTLLTVMPLPALTVIPARNPVPVSVTLTLLPWAPAAGLTADNVGAGGITVNVAAPLVPPAVVTVTFLAPSAAPEAIANVAVALNPEATLTLVTVMPLPALTVIPVRKDVPVNVMLTLLP